jgi:hypothetical protein
LAEIHPDVDQVLSQSRKIDKITSIGVARAGSNSTTLPAAGGGLVVKYNYDAPVA